MYGRMWVLVLCLVVMGAISILAPGLGELRFKPGLPLASEVGTEHPLVLPAIHIPGDIPESDVFFIGLAFVAMLSLLVLLLPPEVRKRILWHMARFALGVLALVLALRYDVLRLPEILLEPQIPAGSGAAPSAAQGQAFVFQPNLIPPWLGFAVGLVVLWACLGLLYISYRWWRRHRDRGSSLLAPIADIARASLGNLAAGRQWGDVVIDAYSRMSETVRAQRGLRRPESWTAREFAARLTRAGLPGGSVETLTELFESVRYGGRPSGDSEARRAVACLQAILEACGATT